MSLFDIKVKDKYRYEYILFDLLIKNKDKSFFHTVDNPAIEHTIRRFKIKVKQVPYYWGNIF